MLTNMFVGNPPGNYDRLLDFSRPVTGTLFFVPSATFLRTLQRRCRRHRMLRISMDIRAKTSPNRGCLRPMARLA
jgi:deferrochelatase/peroxidase EfeB